MVSTKNNVLLTYSYMKKKFIRFTYHFFDYSFNEHLDTNKKKYAFFFHFNKSTKYNRKCNVFTKVKKEIELFDL